jgi:Calcineurin-like phosphoesterase
MKPLPQSSGRRDLQDLRRLSESPILTYWRKQAPPTAPRHKGLRAAASPPPSSLFASLAAFSPSRIWTWFTQYLGHRIGRRHRFLSYAKGDSDQGIYPLEGEGGEIRMALAADWGTGTDEAEAVANQISAFNPHYSVHLGDVYYVGTKTEMEANFLGVPNPDTQYAPCRWPLGSRGTFALNANHEMYALGYGYFENVLPAMGLVRDGRMQGQRASFFCLENEHWRVIALDTGYNAIGIPIIEYFLQPDSRLPRASVEWLRDVVQLRADDPRGIVFLSHHPYFSRFDHCYTKPAKQIAEFVKGPVLWFWGHEHRLAIYEEMNKPGGIRTFGRCVGHGGMPVDMVPTDIPHPEYAVEFTDNRLYPNDEGLTIGFNGFARLTFQGPVLTAQYVDLHGTVVFSESWAAERGNLNRIRYSHLEPG